MQDGDVLAKIKQKKDYFRKLVQKCQLFYIKKYEDVVKNIPL